MSHLKTTTALMTAGLLSVSSIALAEGNAPSMENRTHDYQASESHQEYDRSPDDNASQDNQEWHGGEYGAIDRLPDEGKVTLSGIVADTDPDDNSFVLQDNTGETIDVHTMQNVTLNEGDRVRVSGMMEDEVLGLGEQIVSASVQRIGVR